MEKIIIKTIEEAEAVKAASYKLRMAKNAFRDKNHEMVIERLQEMNNLLNPFFPEYLLDYKYKYFEDKEVRRAYFKAILVEATEFFNRFKFSGKDLRKFNYIFEDL